MNTNSRSLCHFVVIAFTAFTAIGCASQADEGEPEVAHTQQALSAAETPLKNDTDVRLKTLQGLRDSIAKLEELEVSMREVPKTDGAIRQVQAQKARLGERLREVERAR